MSNTRIIKALKLNNIYISIINSYKKSKIFLLEFKNNKNKNLDLSFIDKNNCSVYIFIILNKTNNNKKMNIINTMKCLYNTFI